MKVRVRFFAAPREQLGTGEVELEIPNGATLSQAKEHLFERYPFLREAALQFAVNAVYAGADTPLHEGDEIACIPPVGGG